MLFYVSHFHFLVVQAMHQQTTYTVSEDDGAISLCVTIVGNIEREVEVIFVTEDGTATGNNFNNTEIQLHKH